MLKTIIIDDEPNARQLIANVLELYCEQVDLIGQAENVKSGIKLIHELKPDLVLLDIQMPDGTGFDLLKQIGEIDFNFIFITAYEQYAIKAIKLSALDYILKPINTNELIESIEKAQLSQINQFEIKTKLNNYHNNINLQNSNKRITLNTTDSVYSIKIKDIIYCKSDKNYTDIYFRETKKLLISKTLKDFELLLTDFGFFRVHQSFLVNMNYVSHYEKDGLGGNAILENNTKIPVSSRKREGFLKFLAKM